MLAVRSLPPVRHSRSSKDIGGMDETWHQQLAKHPIFTRPHIPHFKPALLVRDYDLIVATAVSDNEQAHEGSVRHELRRLSLKAYKDAQIQHSTHEYKKKKERVSGRSSDGVSADEEEEGEQPSKIQLDSYEVVVELYTSSAILA